MEVSFDDNGLQDYVRIDIQKPGLVDTQNLAQWKKYVAKARTIILEGVRDHIVSNLHRKETPFAIWNAFIEMFENSSDHRKLAFKEKI